MAASWFDESDPAVVCHGYRPRRGARLAGGGFDRALPCVRVMAVSRPAASAPRPCARDGDRRSGGARLTRGGVGLALRCIRLMGTRRFDKFRSKVV